jgi:ferritin-like metal-binding protein YciE
MAKKTLRDLLIEELHDLYHADKQLLRAFPKLAKDAAAAEVRKLCEEGVDYTNDRIKRLEQAFAKLDTPARAKRCQAMEGLIEEAKEMLAEDLGDALRDAALLANMQKIAHYGIAGYGTVCSYAKAIGENEVAESLAKSLREKKAADQEMTELAERQINPRALVSGEDEPAPRELATAGDKPRARRRRKSAR